MDILTRIKKLQDERGWSNYKLSKESGLSESSVNSMFRVKNTPSFQTLETICDGFGISMAHFFAESGNPVDLTQEQLDLLDAWSTLTDEHKQALMVLLRRN